MTKDGIKKIVKEMVEARIYGDPYRTSDEYDLTPEELNTIKNMSHKQRMTFAAKKIKQARRAKGQCISGGPNCEPPPKNTDGTPGTYCQKHLEQFRVARAKLTKARGSCARCPSTDVVPGNKLCQNCIDALNKPRDKAVETGLCMRCKKVPAAPPTKFCTACMAAKVERNKQIKMRRKGWQDYARDVQAAALAQRVKNLGIQESKLQEIAFPIFPIQVQRVVNIIVDACAKEKENPEEVVGIKNMGKRGDTSELWYIQGPLISLIYHPSKDYWILITNDQKHLLERGSETFYAKNWLTGI